MKIILSGLLFFITVHIYSQKPPSSVDPQGPPPSMMKKAKIGNPSVVVKAEPENVQMMLAKPTI